MSPICIGPLTFLLKILFLSLPSKILHLICIASPLAPVLPITSSTLAGVAGVKLTDPLACSSCGCLWGFFFTCPLSSLRCFVSSLSILLFHPVGYFLYKLLCLAFLHYCNASRRHVNSCGRGKLFLAFDPRRPS